MTKQTLKHLANLAISCALGGLVLSIFPCLVQGQLIKSRAGSGQRPAQRTRELMGSSSSVRPSAPGTATVVDFGTIDYPGTSDSAAYRINDHGQVIGGYGPDLEVDAADSGFSLAKDSSELSTFPALPKPSLRGITMLGKS
jgi:hypothetical protein